MQDLQNAGCWGPTTRPLGLCAARAAAGAHARAISGSRMGLAQDIFAVNRLGFLCRLLIGANGWATALVLIEVLSCFLFFFQLFYRYFSIRNFGDFKLISQVVFSFTFCCVYNGEKEEAENVILFSPSLESFLCISNQARHQRTGTGSYLTAAISNLEISHGADCQEGARILGHGLLTGRVNTSQMSQHLVMIDGGTK